MEDQVHLNNCDVIKIILIGIKIKIKTDEQSIAANEFFQCMFISINATVIQKDKEY